MRRTWLTALALLLAGCGIQPTGVIDAGQAPTGVTQGVTLYFVDANDRLRPQLRRTGHLGTISEALAWLLSGPVSGLRTQITATEGVTRVFVETTPDLIQLRLPLATYEVTPLGIDQIVCTTLGVWVQSGGSRTTRVRLDFTLGADKVRTCPLIR
jgi:hypothetical protein